MLNVYQLRRLHSDSKVFISKKLRTLTTIYGSYFQVAYDVVHNIIIRTRNKSDDCNVRHSTLHDPLFRMVYFWSNPTVVRISDDPTLTYEIVFSRVSYISAYTEATYHNTWPIGYV